MRWTSVIIIVVATGGLAAHGVGGSLDERLQRRPTEVLVAVSDERGRPVTDLTREDFEISSDGASAKVSGVAPGPGPVSIVLLVDVSLSTVAINGASWASGGMRVRESIPPHVLPALMPGDHVQIGSIGRQMSLTQPLSLDRALWNRTLERLVAVPTEMRAGPSPIWDAIGAGIQALKSTSPRRAVMLVTDGKSTGNRLRLADVLGRAIEEGVIIDAVGERVEHATGRLERAKVQPPEALLAQLATDSGGHYVEDHAGPARARRQPEPGPIVAQFVTTLRQRFAVVIEPPVADGRLHRLDVRVTRPGLTVRAPRVYLAEK